MMVDTTDHGDGRVTFSASVQEDETVAALKKRVAELEKALLRYGNHGGGCAAAYPVGVEAPCSCGYEEALSQDKKEQPDG